MIIGIGSSRVELVHGNIVLEQVDAIVNAANSALMGGGGVDGAIHQAGGPSIMEETDAKYPHGCPTGSAVVTGAGRLRAKYVFHAVGPIWRGGQGDEAEKLASAHRRCLELATELGCQSVSFPALSTGAFGYPVDAAAEVAVGAVCEFLLRTAVPLHVRFVLFDTGTFGAFARVLELQLHDGAPR